MRSAGFYADAFKNKLGEGQTGQVAKNAMARRKKIPIAPQIKRLLGFSEDDNDADVLTAWKSASTRVCKPCWELKYCPYGPLVEQFPLLPPTRASVEEHNEYLKRCLANNTFGEYPGRPMTDEDRTRFTEMLAHQVPEQFPDAIPEEIQEMSCRVFGHICPVVFAAEGFTETANSRRMSRKVSTRVMMRVARRDNYMCQECGRGLRDFEIEFDHIIPVAKGGSSEEHNVRVTCFDCNRSKSDALPIDLIDR